VTDVNPGSHGKSRWRRVHRSTTASTRGGLAPVDSAVYSAGGGDSETRRDGARYVRATTLTSSTRTDGCS
jgi:hypothetical protein